MVALEDDTPSDSAQLFQPLHTHIGCSLSALVCASTDLAVNNLFELELGYLAKGCSCWVVEQSCSIHFREVAVVGSFCVRVVPPLLPLINLMTNFLDASPDPHLEILLEVNLNFQVRLTIILANGIFPR